MNEIIPIRASRVTSYEPKRIRKNTVIENNLDFISARVFVIISPYLKTSITDAESENLQMQLRCILRQVKKSLKDLPD